MFPSPYALRPSHELQGSSANDTRIWFASADMQGWRLNMEDRQKTILNLEEGIENAKPVTYLALFDGHLGSCSARYAAANLSEKLLDQEAYHMRQYSKALRSAFLSIDEEICSLRRNRSGSTGLVALMSGEDSTTVHIGHVGDSRAVICTGGRASDLTSPHTADLAEEGRRILKAGGFLKNDRVCGRLAMTRSFGNVRFKNKRLRPEEQIVTAVPSLISHQVRPEDEFLVLASDGIWECFSSQEVIDIIRYQISLGATLTQACAFICNTCLAPWSCKGREEAPCGTDNMTIIVVAFLHGQMKVEWMEWITERVKTKVGWVTPSTIPQLYGDAKPLQHPAHITTDFDLTLSPPAEPPLLVHDASYRVVYDWH